MVSNEFFPTQAIHCAVKSEADQILSAQGRPNIVGPDETCRDAIVMMMMLVLSLGRVRPSPHPLDGPPK